MMKLPTLKRWLIITTLLVILGVISAWVLALNSDAYLAADIYLENSKDVKLRFGTIKSTSLRGFKISTNHAYLNIHIKGSKNEGRAILNLKKDNQWRINAATFDN